MESKLCMNCFAEYHDGNICPVCGWDSERPQVAEGLQYNTVLASRYVIGRAKSMNGEGITYSALDRMTNTVVEIREFFPMSLAARSTQDQSVLPLEGSEVVFEQYLSDFLTLSRGVSRLRELSVVTSVIEIFEENYTAYTVYEYEPTVSLRRYVADAGGRLTWNDTNRIFMPALTALGLMNSLGVSHLGISPDTLRVTQNGGILITGFCIAAARRKGTPIIEELFKGFSAIEQYRSSGGICGEISDVYSFASTMLFALTGQVPHSAPERLQDQRLMISKDVLKMLPPYAVTAIANALQVKQSSRTGSFERFKSELSAAPTVINGIDQTDAIRRLPPIDMTIPQNRGLPPVVWLIGSCVITFIALFIVASMWLEERGMSFSDIPKAFNESSAVGESLTVPYLVNESYEEWEQKIANGEYDFTIKVSTQEFSDTVAQGHIISQSPFSGESMAAGDEVLVTVSKGSAIRTLPETAGMSYGTLQEVLTENGFLPQRQDQPSADIEPGYVIGYLDHAAGDSLDYGSSVTVIVSSGSDTGSAVSETPPAE